MLPFNNARCTHSLQHLYMFAKKRSPHLLSCVLILPSHNQQQLECVGTHHIIKQTNWRYTRSKPFQIPFLNVILYRKMATLIANFQTDAPIVSRDTAHLKISLLTLGGGLNTVYDSPHDGTVFLYAAYNFTINNLYF